MLNRIVCVCALVGALAAAVGCESQPRISYSNTDQADMDFDNGANRPPTPDTLYRMALLLEAQEKDEQAHAVYLNTIDRFPDYVPAYNGLAALHVRQGRVDAGIHRLEQAHQLSPNDPVILNALGMCWMLKSEHEKSLEYFTRAASLAPDDTRYRANMALATGMLGRYDESYALYEQFLRPARAHYNLSVVAEARNDMAKADEEFSKARALDSTIERKPRAKSN
jgi:tetratricopeptide (TPR) repeat protein